MIPIYLDPGSGSFILQLIIAGITGLGIAIASKWAKIKKSIYRGKKHNGNIEDDEGEGESE